MKVVITEKQLKTLRDMNEMAYPSSFNMEYFKSLKTFKERVEYCNTNLVRLGSGSSRIAYRIDNEKVLKLAKNQKGLMQNEEEARLGYNENYFDCIAKVFDYDDNYKFIEMELAMRCNEKEFQRITGYDFQTYYKFLSAFKNDKLHVFFDQDFIDKAYDEISIMTEVGDLIMQTNILLTDLNRIEQYGVVKREGVEQIVITDYGFTKKVHPMYNKNR